MGPFNRLPRSIGVSGSWLNNNEPKVESCPTCPSVILKEKFCLKCECESLKFQVIK